MPRKNLIKDLDKYIEDFSLYATKEIVNKIKLEENILFDENLVQKFIYPECCAICSIIYNFERSKTIYLNKIRKNKKINKEIYFLKFLFSFNFLMKVSKIMEKKPVIFRSTYEDNQNKVERNKIEISVLIIKKFLTLFFIKLPLYLNILKSNFLKYKYKKNKTYFSHKNHKRLDEISTKILYQSSLINIFSKKLIENYKKNKRFIFKTKGNIFSESIQVNFVERYKFIFKSYSNTVYQHGGLRGIVNYRRLDLEFFSDNFLSFYNKNFFNKKTYNKDNLPNISGKSPILKIDKIAHKLEFLLSRKINHFPNLVFYLSNHDLNKSYIDYGIVLSPEKTIAHIESINKLINFCKNKNIEISIRSRPGRLNKKYNYFKNHKSNLVANNKTLAIIDHPGRILLERIELNCPFIFWGNPDEYDLSISGAKLFKKLESYNLVVRDNSKLKDIIIDFKYNKEEYLNNDKYNDFFKWYDSKCKGGHIFGLYQFI